MNHLRKKCIPGTWLLLFSLLGKTSLVRNEIMSYSVVAFWTMKWNTVAVVVYGVVSCLCAIWSRAWKQVLLQRPNLTRYTGMPMKAEQITRNRAASWYCSCFASHFAIYTTVTHTQHGERIPKLWICNGHQRAAANRAVGYEPWSEVYYVKNTPFVRKYLK